MKKFFRTPKQAVISTICIMLLVLAVIAAAGAVFVRSALIGKNEAKAIALQDAGLTEADTSALRTKLDLDDGRFQYEVDFYSNGTEYEYRIQAKDGGIISRDIDGGSNLPQNSANAGNTDDALSGQTGQTQTDASAQPAPDANDDGSGRISSNKAKTIALKDANLSKADVTFTKTRLDRDDGVSVYEIEFYTGDSEYDYEIDAYDGSIRKRSSEALPAPSSASGGTDSSGGTGISVEQAKKIALNHANLNESDVRFVKANLDYDDGRSEYEIEFYYNRQEYSYTIDPASGTILEYDIDND